jgi:hypothetical protein
MRHASRGLRSHLGDIRVSGRWQLFRTSLAGALELRLKTPTGYDAPAGTFGRDRRNAEDFLENVVSYVKPENVSDDVTLGDGQLDIGGAILLGWASMAERRIWCFVKCAWTATPTSSTVD